MNVWLRWRVDINNSNKKLCWLYRIVKVDMELMQRVTYRWRRRVNFARSSSNCHNLLLISESWESWRVCLTHRSTHLRWQPKDANLVWWTLCDFILKNTPSLFLSLQSHHPIVSQLERGRLFRVVEKRSWFAFALREWGRSPGRCPLICSLTTSFFSFCFWRARARALVSAQRWILKGIWGKARFSICAQTALCASFSMHYRIHVFLSLVFEKKKRNIMIFHLNNMLIHIYDYIVVKCHSCCSWRIHTVSANKRPLAVLTVSKHLWHVGVYWYVAVCCSVIQRIWVFQVSLFPHPSNRFSDGK